AADLYDLGVSFRLDAESPQIFSHHQITDGAESGHPKTLSLEILRFIDIRRHHETLGNQIDKRREIDAVGALQRRRDRSTTGHLTDGRCSRYHRCCHYGGNAEQTQIHIETIFFKETSDMRDPGPQWPRTLHRIGSFNLSEWCGYA